MSISIQLRSNAFDILVLSGHFEDLLKTSAHVLLGALLLVLVACFGFLATELQNIFVYVLLPLLAYVCSRLWQVLRVTIGMVRRKAEQQKQQYHKENKSADEDLDEQVDMLLSSTHLGNTKAPQPEKSS